VGKAERYRRNYGWRPANPSGNKARCLQLRLLPPKVKAEVDTLVIKGSDFKLIQENKPEFTVEYGRGVSYKEIDKNLFDEFNNVEISKPSGELGLQDINIKRRFTTKEVEFGGNKNAVTVEILYVYNGQFRLIKDLDISGTLRCTRIVVFPEAACILPVQLLVTMMYIF